MAISQTKSMIQTAITLEGYVPEVNERLNFERYHFMPEVRFPRPTATLFSAVVAIMVLSDDSIMSRGSGKQVVPSTLGILRESRMCSLRSSQDLGPRWQRWQHLVEVSLNEAAAMCT